MISNCTFQKDLIIGSALSMIGDTHVSETEVEIDNCTFYNNLKCEGNSSTRVNASSMLKINIKHNATVVALDTPIVERLSVRDHSFTELMNSPVDSILIDDTAFLKVKNGEKISMVYFFGFGKYENEISASFIETRIQNIYINTKFSSTISFQNAEVGNISFYNDINATFECINSTFDNLVRMRSGENVSLNFIIVNSTSPDLTIINENITVGIFYRLLILVKLNDQPLETEVILRDDHGSMWSGKSLSGRISFDLLYKFIENETVFINQNYHLTSSYLGFFETEDVLLISSKTVVFDWEDIKPPTVTNISVEPSGWYLGKEITISANIKDEGVESINAVTLHYRVNNGEWKEIIMFRTDENTYAAAIPKQGAKCTVTYYISSQDNVDNIGNSEMQSISIGEEENLMYFGGAAIVIGIILIGLVWKVMIYRKINE
jgi:hypothetical protein